MTRAAWGSPVVIAAVVLWLLLFCKALPWAVDHEAQSHPVHAGQRVR